MSSRRLVLWNLSQFMLENIMLPRKKSIFVFFTCVMPSSFKYGVAKPKSIILILVESKMSLLPFESGFRSVLKSKSKLSNFRSLKTMPAECTCSRIFRIQMPKEQIDSIVMQLQSFYWNTSCRFIPSRGITKYI